jgi:O-antigen ligase
MNALPWFSSDETKAGQLRSAQKFAAAPSLALDPKIRRKSLLALLTLRHVPWDLRLILVYTALSRAFIGDEATLGIKVGPVPLFITDALLMLVILINIRKRRGRLLDWLLGGNGTGAIGRAVWLLFLLAIVYCAVALPNYGIMALHDLAIFGYCIFFPLTLFSFSRHQQAAKVVRYFVYGTTIGAVLFNFQTISGAQLFTLYNAGKGLPGHEAISHLTAGNLGAALGPGLAGLFAYLATEREHRALHLVAFLLCLTALAQIMDRSAFLGFSIAAGLLFMLGVGRARSYLIVFGTSLCFILLLSAQGELPIPGGKRLNNFWLIVSSGANFQNDPDAQFRLQRWRKTTELWLTSPLVGVGFGTPLLLNSAGENLRGEVKMTQGRGGLGAFNVGMPHNSFLMAAARTGLLGLGLICFAWFAGIYGGVKRLTSRHVDSDQAASVCALLAMVTTAGLNLFFERPMLSAPFWIMLAASCGLSEIVHLPRLTKGFAKRVRSQAALSAGNLTFTCKATAKEPAGAWQARWQ